MSDVIFGIGGDNSELERSNAEALRIIERWVADAQAVVENLQGPSLEGDAEQKIDTLIQKLQELDAVNTRLGVDTSAIKQAAAELDDLKARAETLSVGDITVIEGITGVADQANEATKAFEAQQNAVAQVKNIFTEFNAETDKNKLSEKLKQSVSELNNLTDGERKALQVFSDFNDEAARDELSKALIAGSKELGGFNDGLAQSKKALEETLVSLGRMVTIIGVVGGAAVAVHNAVIEWEKEASGFNRELERTKELQDDLLANEKERLRVRRETAGEEIDDSEDGSTASATLDAAKAELEAKEEAARLAGEALTRATSANNASQRRLNQTIVERIQNNDPPTLDDLKSQGRFDTATERDKQAQDDLKKQQALVDELEKKQEEANKNQAKRQADINKSIEREISLRREAALRAQDTPESIVEADRERVRRERRDDLDRTAGLGREGSQEAANQLANARARQREAEDNKYRQDEAERMGKKREQIEERIGGLRRRQADLDERNSRRAEDFALRRKKITEETKSILGGFDTGLVSLSNRIAASANSTPDDRQAEQLRALDRSVERFNSDSSKQRDRIVDAIMEQTNALKQLNTGMS